MAINSQYFILFAIFMAFFTMTMPVFSASVVMQRASKTLLEKGLVASDAKIAKHLFEQAIVADPANTAPLNALGKLYKKEGKITLARKYYGIALIIDPTELAALCGIEELGLADSKT